METAPPRIHRRVIEALMEGVCHHPDAHVVVARALARTPAEALHAPWEYAAFRRLVDEIANLLSPEDPGGTGQRLAGHAFSQGWSRHSCGRVFVDALRNLPLSRAVVRLADGLRFGAEGLELEATPLGVNRMRLLLRGGISPNTAFLCGCLEEMLRLLGAARAEAIPEPAPEDNQPVLISWEDPG